MALIDRGEASRQTGWITPNDFFDLVKKEFGKFDLDVCATKEDAKADRWIEEDSLSKEWKGLCWMNPPPYDSKGIMPWIKKAYNTGKSGHTVVCLLPALTDQIWFHRYIMRASEVRFIKGRLRFSNARYSASFPSMLVIFSGSEDTRFGTMVRRENE